MKHIFNKTVFGAFLLALLCLFGVGTTAYAAEASTGRIDVTLPTQIPIMTDAEGNTTVPDNLVIQNNSTSSYLHLDSAALIPASGWHFDAAGDDVFSYGPGTKGFAMKLFDKSASYNSAESQYVYDLSGLDKVDALSSVNMKCDAYVPAQKTTSGNETIADVIFTVHSEEIPVPVLASGSSWYKSTVSKNTITSVTFQNRYDDKADARIPDETWDASAAQNGSIMAYLYDSAPAAAPDSPTAATTVFASDATALSGPSPASHYLIITGNGTDTIKAHSDSSSMFADFTLVTSIENLDILDTSNVTDMSNMFSNCSCLTALNISQWDTSAVANMRMMFNNCSGLATLDLSGWDTSSVTNWQYCFRLCTTLAEITLGENFVFPEDGAATTKPVFPTPSSAYIPDADGNWYTADGTFYSPQSIPSGMANTYYAFVMEEEPLYLSHVTKSEDSESQTVLDAIGDTADDLSEVSEQTPTEEDVESGSGDKTHDDVELPSESENASQSGSEPTDGDVENEESKNEPETTAEVTPPEASEEEKESDENAGY